MNLFAASHKEYDSIFRCISNSVKTLSYFIIYDYIEYILWKIETRFVWWYNSYKYFYVIVV